MNYLISSSNFSVRLPLTEATRELVRRDRRVRRCLWIPNMFDHSANSPLNQRRGGSVERVVPVRSFCLYCCRGHPQWFHSVSTSFSPRTGCRL